MGCSGGPRGVLECANFDTNSQGRIFSSFTKIVDFAFFSASGIPRIPSQAFASFFLLLRADRSGDLLKRCFISLM